MPEKLDRCVKSVMSREGKPKSSAYAICKASIKKGGKKKGK